MPGRSCSGDGPAASSWPKAKAKFAQSRGAGSAGKPEPSPATLGPRPQTPPPLAIQPSPRRPAAPPPHAAPSGATHYLSTSSMCPDRDRPPSPEGAFIIHPLIICSFRWATVCQVDIVLGVRHPVVNRSLWGHSHTKSDSMYFIHGCILNMNRDETRLVMQ